MVNLPPTEAAKKKKDSDPAVKEKDAKVTQMMKMNKDFIQYASITLAEMSKSLNEIKKWKYPMAGIASLLAVVTDSHENLSDSSKIKCKDLFLEMERKVRIYKTVFGESNEFINDLITIASNIINFTDISTKSSMKVYADVINKEKSKVPVARRLSAESDAILLSIGRMRAIGKTMLKAINRITKGLCLIKNQTTFITPNLQININLLDLKYDINMRKDIQYVNLQDGSTVFVPIDELKRQTTDLND
jgi:hypothetical protein